MFARFLLAVAVIASPLAVSSAPVAAMPSVRASAVGWRGGYRFRGNYIYAPRRSTRRWSPLDYPASTQPEATRRHQWNKYPNQPYYLRGERKSLLILP